RLVGQRGVRSCPEALALPQVLAQLLPQTLELGQLRGVERLVAPVEEDEAAHDLAGRHHRDRREGARRALLPGDELCVPVGELLEGTGDQLPGTDRVVERDVVVGVDVAPGGGVATIPVARGERQPTTAALDERQPHPTYGGTRGEQGEGRADPGLGLRVRPPHGRATHPDSVERDQRQGAQGEVRGYAPPVSPTSSLRRSSSDGSITDADDHPLLA